MYGLHKYNNSNKLNSEKKMYGLQKYNKSNKINSEIYLLPVVLWLQTNKNLFLDQLRFHLIVYVLHLQLFSQMEIKILHQFLWDRHRLLLLLGHLLILLLDRQILVLLDQLILFLYLMEKN